MWHVRETLATNKDTRLVSSCSNPFFLSFSSTAIADMRIFPALSVPVRDPELAFLLGVSVALAPIRIFDLLPEGYTDRRYMFLPPLVAEKQRKARDARFAQLILGSHRKPVPGQEQGHRMVFSVFSVQSKKEQ